MTSGNRPSQGSAAHSFASRHDVHAALDEWLQQARPCAEPVDLAATVLGLRSWSTHFAQEAMEILEWRRDGRQEALLPLATHSRGLGPLALRHGSSPGNFHWQFGYPMVSGHLEGAMAATLEHLRQRRDWDVLDLGPMLASSAHAQAIRSLGASLGMPANEVGRKHDPIVRLDRPWGAYWAGLSRNLRETVGIAQRRLEREGPLTLFEYTGGPDLETRLQAFYKLEAAGWKGRDGTAIMSDPNVEAFYTDLAREAAAAGQLRLYEMRVGDELVACDYCLACGNTVQVLKIAYDEGRARLSPGQVIRKLVLQRLFEQGDTAIYDLRPGGGDHGAYKLRWANARRVYVVLRLFNPATLRGRLARRLADARRVWRGLRAKAAPS